MNLLPSTLLLCALGATTMAHADTFEYQFKTSFFDGYDQNHNEYIEFAQFSYLSPVLVTASETVTADSSSYYDPRTSVWHYDPLTVLLDPKGGSGLGEIELTGKDLEAGVSFGSAGTPWFAVGTHTDGSTVLAITDIPSPPAAVPEPSTLALLGSGLVGLVGFGRRRLAR